MTSLSRIAILLIGLTSMSVCCDFARAEPIAVPVVTIYPGDIIAAEMLADQEMGAASGTYLSREAILGRTARRTLLPGKPVLSGSVGEARVVRAGALVQLVLETGPLEILVRGVAMQNGAVGETISVRNSRSGRLVNGVVTSEGTIRISEP